MSVVLFGVNKRSACKGRKLLQLRKRERICRQIYPTRQNGRADIFNYIEMFYNHQRRHNTSGSVSPVEFENAEFNSSEESSRSGSIQFRWRIIAKESLSE